jgi:hypothetical protein
MLLAPPPLTASRTPRRYPKTSPTVILRKRLRWT